MPATMKKSPAAAPAATAPMNQEVLTLSETAAYLRVDEDAVRRLADDGTIPARRIGKEWRFLKSAIQYWLAGCSSGMEARAAKPGSKERVLATAGIWKDDPSVDEMLKEIYRQ